MSKPSGPDRAELLKLAAAVADGDSLRPRRAGGERAIAGLRVIAALSQRLGTSAADVAPVRTARQALFQWGHLDVIGPLGEGSSAEVFRAYDPLLDIEVALKLSRPSLGRRATAEWIAEARRLARLRHPNVVAVHGVDVHGGRAGLWLDLVEGETLLVYGERAGPLHARELCLTGIELCKGLAAIHQSGLLHRDLKPTNLLRESSGRILVADFGAAGATSPAGQGQSERGTPLTMAPEIIDGGNASIASDLYSLGAVLHWLATGRLPVVAADLDELRVRHRQRSRHPEPVRIAGIGDTLAGLIGDLLAHDPRQRPGDAHDVERRLANELDLIASTTTGPVRPDAADARPAGIDFDAVLGREAELAWLQQEQRRAFLGHARPVFLVGDSGTGKTTLVRSFGDWLRARDGRLVHVALGGYPPGRRRLLTLVERAVDPASNRLSSSDDFTLTGYLEQLLAQTPALVLCFDDLEYADDGERAQIRQLFQDLRGSPALCIAAQRAEGHPGSDVIASLFADSAHSLLMLEPFTAAQSANAVGGLLRAPAYDHDLGDDTLQALHRLSGGNPFFLTELLRHLQATGALTVDHGQRHWHLHALPDTLPASLELAALERCRALDPDTHDVIAAAAVIGERFRIDTLQSLLPNADGRIETHVGRAIAAGLVDCISEETLRFRHGLIQRVLYDAMPAEMRQRLHSTCVALLRDLDHPETASWLSLHAERAGDPQTAFDAGYAALVNPRLPEMATPAQCERLHSLIDAGARATPAQRVEIDLRRLRGLCSAGLLREAIDVAQSLQRSGQRKPGSTADLRLRVAHAEVTFAYGRHAEAINLLAPALEAPSVRHRRHRALLEEARLLTVRAQAALGDYRTAEHVIAAALDEPTHDPAVAIELRSLYGWCLALQGRLREADDILDRAMRMAASATAAQRAYVLRRLQWVKLCRGRYQQAYSLALAAHAEFRAAGDAMGQAKMSMSLGQTRLMQGLPEEACGFFNRTVLRLETIGDHHCEAETEWMLGRACTELGRHDEADTHLARALELIAHVGDRDDEFRFLIERARLRLAQDRAQDAFDDARTARTIALELDSLDGAAFAAIEMAAALLAQGDVQAALDHCEPAARTLRKMDAGERWRADWLLGRCRNALDPSSAEAAAAFSAAATAIEHIIAELDPSDHPRRDRIRRIRQPQLDGAPTGTAP